MNQEIGVQEQYVYETASPWRNRGSHIHYIYTIYSYLRSSLQLINWSDLLLGKQAASTSRKTAAF